MMSREGSGFGMAQQDTGYRARVQGKGTGQGCRVTRGYGYRGQGYRGKATVGQVGYRGCGYLLQYGYLKIGPVWVGMASLKCGTA